MRQLLRTLMLCIVVFSAASESAFAQASDSKPTLEYQIKASLTFNFIQFIRWPVDTPPAEFRLCVVGKDRFGTAISGLNGELVEGSKLIIIHLPLAHREDLLSCQLFFISGDSDINVPEILREVKDRAVLTVGETAEFLDQGGMISLQLEHGKVVFDINRSAARNARLDVSSKLLRLARTVRE